MRAELHLSPRAVTHALGASGRSGLWRDLVVAYASDVVLARATAAFPDADVRVGVQGPEGDIGDVDVTVELRAEDNDLDPQFSNAAERRRERKLAFAFRDLVADALLQIRRSGSLDVRCRVAVRAALLGDEPADVALSLQRRLRRRWSGVRFAVDLRHGIDRRGPVEAEIWIGRNNTKLAGPEFHVEEVVARWIRANLRSTGVQSRPNAAV